MNEGGAKILQAMMKKCLSEPGFEFDEDHSYFAVTLPAHPAAPSLVEAAAPWTAGAVTWEVVRLLTVLCGEIRLAGLRAALDRKREDHFRWARLLPALAAGLLEMTLPDRPHSSKQRRRLTNECHAWVASRGDR